MFIARKITNESKFTDWCHSACPFARDSAELDEFSLVIDWDENPRTLKRRIYSRYHGYFERVLIFRETTLVSWRDMVFSKRWHKWFENK